MNTPANIEMIRAQALGQSDDGGSVNGPLAHEQAAEPRRQATRGGRVVGESLDEIGPGPASSLAEKRRLVVIVQPGRLVELAIHDGPAGERPCRCFNIGLGVMADTEREKLH